MTTLNQRSKTQITIWITSQPLSDLQPHNYNRRNIIVAK